MVKILLSTLILMFPTLCLASNWEEFAHDTINNNIFSVDLDSVSKQYYGERKTPFVSAWFKVSYNAPQFSKNNDTAYYYSEHLIAFNCPSKRYDVLVYKFYDKKWNLIKTDVSSLEPSLNTAERVNQESYLNNLYKMVCHASLANELKAGYWDDPNDTMKLLNEYPIQHEELGSLKKTDEVYSPDKYKIVK